MLNSKTVFILGAGASFEVGFPLGSELRKKISTKLDISFDYHSSENTTGDVKIYSRIAQKYSSNLNAFAHACWHIRDGIILSDQLMILLTPIKIMNVLKFVAKLQLHIRSWRQKKKFSLCRSK